MEPQLPKRSRIEANINNNINMPELIGVINNILGDISLPQEEADEQVKNIIRQFNESLQTIALSATQRRTQAIAAIETENRAQMAEEERNQALRQIDDFKTHFLEILNSPEVMALSYGQRKHLFSSFLRTSNIYFTNLNINNHLDADAVGIYRLKALWGAMMEVLGTCLAGLKEQGPEYAKKTSAVLAALFMFIGMLHEDIRTQVASSIPVIGPLVKATWVARPYLSDWMQAGAGITMIYYFLKNAGIETAPLVEALGSSSQRITRSIGSATQKISKSLFDRISSSVGNAITGAISRWVTSDLNNFTLNESQYSQLSEGTAVATSVSSALSIQSVNVLLQNNVPENIGDLDNNIDAVSPLQDLHDDDNVILQRVEIMNVPEIPEAHEVEVSVAAIPVAEAVGLNISPDINSQESDSSFGTIDYSQGSYSSISSSGSTVQVPYWFWNSNRRGGKRRHKRRTSKKHSHKKHVSMKKGRKGRKYSMKRNSNSKRRTMRRKH